MTFDFDLLGVYIFCTMKSNTRAGGGLSTLPDVL